MTQSLSDRNVASTFQRHMGALHGVRLRAPLMTRAGWMRIHDAEHARARRKTTLMPEGFVPHHINDLSTEREEQ